MSDKPLLTADLCDDHPDVRVCQMTFIDFAKRTHFHGQITTFSTFEDNKGIREILAEGGKGRVLVVDGRGSRRRALTGGNIAAEAEQYGWEGLVYNGCIRDQHEFTDLDLGVKAMAATPMRPRTDGIGLKDVDVNFGGIVIRPGEWLYADLDGVIVSEKKLHD